MQDAAAQDPIGGAILGGAAGAIIGGAVGGGRGAATGAIIGGVTGAAIAAQGQPRPGGYRYYENACYLQRPDGAWLVVSPEYCVAPAEPVVVAPPPPPRYHDELGDRLMEFREACEDGDRRACVSAAKIASDEQPGGVNIRMRSFTSAEAARTTKQASNSSTNHGSGKRRANRLLTSASLW